MSRKIHSGEDLEQWLADLSEVEAVLSDDLAWRYISMSRDTTDKAAEKSFRFFIQEVEPLLRKKYHELNKMLVSCADAGLAGEEYEVYVRSARNETELFREQNIPLVMEMHLAEQRFGSIASAMTVMIDGQEKTMQQAGVYLKNPDRGKREEVFRKVASRRLQDKRSLDDLLTDLIKLRTGIAGNAGFGNYRDYKHRESGRFDYTVSDCRRFHESVSAAVMPVCSEILEERKKQMGLDTLRPWDLDADPGGRPGLKPFTGGDELLEKSLRCFDRVDPLFGDFLRTMKNEGRFDLDSRKGKAPGGYNYPLYETGIPFIFMNSAGTQSDLVTMVHEGGHAVHSFLSHPLKLTAFKGFTSEIAELASMSMEMMTMDHWDMFYSNFADLQRARIEQLERVIEILPWVAAIDSFQHWLYTHHNHSMEEREKAWREISSRFTPKQVDWSGFEDYFSNQWQKQLHIFEAPFYYIEYGIAQLGALAIWKLYRQDPVKAINSYKAALRLGYTRPIPEVYKAAGIRFDFSESYIKETVLFAMEERAKLKKGAGTGH